MNELEHTWRRYACYLAPLGAMYSAAMRVRAVAYSRGLFRQRRSTLPVVSVGNLGLGGSGKTPTVEWLARSLSEKGLRPAVVSRGYGRRTPADQLVVVSKGTSVLASPEEGGDEPVMLARNLPDIPIVVCSDRFRASEYVAQQGAADCIVLDDGFQHLALARDFDLVLLDSRVTGERVFPAGYLREPLSALARADAFLVSEQAQNNGDFLRWLEREFPGRPVFSMRSVPGPIRRHQTGDQVEPGEIAGQRLLAFAGIAAPERFFEALRRLGLSIVEEPLEDHAAYTQERLSHLAARARDATCGGLITTAKDAVKIPNQAIPDGLPLYVLHQQLEIDRGDELIRLILDRFSRRR